MSDGSAWEREALSIKQVPSLQALLRCCDERLLVRAIVEEHAVLAGDWDALPAKRKRAAEKRLAATLATMRGLPLDKKGGVKRRGQWKSLKSNRREPQTYGRAWLPYRWRNDI